jgi:hypothetical protein
MSRADKSFSGKMHSSSAGITGSRGV